MTVQAIPTRYAGYHFRSRLEARWAVFFDAMKWKWQYEPEGYQLPAGMYLPDFLVDDGIWVEPHYFEVKGADPNEDEIRKAWQLADTTGKWVTFLGQIPREIVHDTHVVTTCDGKRVVVDYVRCFAKLPISVVQSCPCCDPEKAKHGSTFHRKRLSLLENCTTGQAALDAARSARFEHGHSGAS